MTWPASEDRAPADAFKITRWHIVALTLIVLLAAILRIHNLSATSVWCDELLSIHISNAHAFSVDRLPRDQLLTDVPDLMSIKSALPWYRVWGGMGGDMHPPLYYVMLRGWREVFGDSPAGIRSLSVVFTTLAVLASFFAGRELVGATAGLWVALLCAVAADHIYYGQEARMYAAVLFWATAAMAIVLRIGRRGFNWRLGVGLIVCSAAGMLSLYLTCAILTAAAAYAVVRFKGRDRVNTLASFAIAGAIFVASWVPFLLGQNFYALKSDWLKASPEGHLQRTLEYVGTLPTSHFAVLLQSSTVYAYGFAILYPLPLLFIKRCPAILLPWLGTLLVVLFPLVADLLRTTNMLMWSRYTILMVPTLAMAIVAMAWQAPPRLRWILPAAMVVQCVVSLPALYQKERYDYRAHAAVAERIFDEGGRRLVFMTTWNEKFDSVLLLSMQYFWKQPPRECVFVESPAALRALPRSITGDRIVLVAGDLAADISQLPEYAVDGPTTWQLGVGSVTALRRLPATDATTQPAPVGAGR